MIRAVLFDLDGVFIETEHETFKFYQEWLREQKGIILPDSAFKYKAGRKSIPFFHDALNTNDVQRVDIPALIALKREKFNREISRFVSRVAGGEQLLQYLRVQGYRIALASQNEKRMIDSATAWLGIKGYFDIILSVEDIINKKPDPEIYLLAAQRLGVSPEQCIVVEDSLDGIRSANNAGMLCISLFHDYMPPETYQTADMVVRSLSEITSERITGLKKRA